MSLNSRKALFPGCHPTLYHSPDSRGGIWQEGGLSSHLWALDNEDVMRESPTQDHVREECLNNLARIFA